MNPLKLMQLKNSWDKFANNHPKFPMFLKNISGNDVIKKDTIIEINIATAEGRHYSSNLKITEEDLKLLADLKEMSKN